MTIRIIVAVAATIIAGLTTLSAASEAATPDIRGGNSAVSDSQKPGAAGRQTISVNRRDGGSSEDRHSDVHPDPSERNPDISRRDRP